MATKKYDEAVKLSRALRANMVEESDNSYVRKITLDGREVEVDFIRNKPNFANTFGGRFRRALTGE